MKSRLQVVADYYRNVLLEFKLYDDVINIIVSFILDLYIHERKQKFLHFFNTHTIIYQTYIDERISERTFAIVSKNMLGDIFNARGFQLVARPLTYAPLKCTERKQREFWMGICWYVMIQKPGMICASNWQITVEERLFNGLPLVYFFSDIIKIRYDEVIQKMGILAYKQDL